jgi:hypothetical protein
VPTGGTTSQVLTKTSSTDYATAWQTPSPGLTLPLGQNLTFSPDNTYDIGGSASTLRPRNVYAGTSVITPLLGATTIYPGTTTTNPNVAAAPMAFPNAVGLKVNLYDLGAGNTYGVGVSANELYFSAPGSAVLSLRSNSGSGTQVWKVSATDGSMGWSNIGVLTPTGNVLEQRNGASPQTLRIYGTYTDASNYERGTLRWTGNSLFLNTENAGTGVARNLFVRSAGNALYVGTNNTDQWLFLNSAIFAITDNTGDIGQSGANRPRNGFFAGAVATGGKAGAAVDGDVNTPTDGMLRFDSTNNRLYIRIGAVWRYATLT